MLWGQHRGAGVGICWSFPCASPSPAPAPDFLIFQLLFPISDLQGRGSGGDVAVLEGFFKALSTLRAESRTQIPSQGLCGSFTLCAPPSELLIPQDFVPGFGSGLTWVGPGWDMTEAVDAAM